LDKFHDLSAVLKALEFIILLLYKLVCIQNIDREMRLNFVGLFLLF